MMKMNVIKKIAYFNVNKALFAWRRVFKWITKKINTNQV